MKKFLLLLPFLALVTACTHGNCRVQKKATAPSQNEVIVEKHSTTDRVKVYKYDGSLQCGQGKAVAVADMQKDLKEIKVYSATNQNDGMMRIQLCGSPTGNANVYEIDRKDLPAALAAGFKEWTFE
nr:hypothetical protein HAGR004_19120 [Bdellovibrio sp. HAGR004]